MLAKRRSLLLNGVEIERTPLLIPSFSSKGFPDVKKIIEYSSELITDVTLFSAYDLHYGHIEGPFNFPSLIFLDSGGYEASKDVELSDLGDREHKPKAWTEEMFQEQVSKWAADVPSVVISYDHPKERLSIADQIKRARALKLPQGEVLREVLIKPSTALSQRVDINDLVKHIRDLADFDVIGVTEKEIGRSISDRMKNIAKLRLALTKIGLETPIHIFGSLDTVTTPMYFLAGADIFDGLTWLRFAFRDGQTLYKHNFCAVEHGAHMNASDVNGRCWNNNIYYMTDMQNAMRRYLKDHDFSHFAPHSQLFNNAINNVLEELGEE